MRLAIIRIMMLSLLRDKAALAMGFVLPGIVFAIFAVIFSGASGGELAIRVGVVDQRMNASSKGLLDELFRSDKLRRVELSDADEKHLAKAVREGAVDAGLVLFAGSGALERPPLAGLRHFEILTDPSKEIANTMLEGSLQRAYAERLPRAPGADRVVSRRAVIQSDAGFSAVSYYAGAVAMMFLLFSSLTTSLSYLEERETGLFQRIALGPGGTGIVIDGKFGFLVLQGFIQTAIVFLVAWRVFGLQLPDKIVPWAVVALSSAICAAGLALAFVTFCRTKRQAETVGQMLVLVISAIGGSMVPRFLMPSEIQMLGWFTPNTWALEAYALIFWRGETINSLLIHGAVLTATGIAGLMIARMLSGINGASLK